MFQKFVDSWMDLLEPVINVRLPHYQHWIDAQNHMIRQQSQAVGNMSPMIYDVNHQDVHVQLSNGHGAQAKICHQ